MIMMMMMVVMLMVDLRQQGWGKRRGLVVVVVREVDDADSDGDLKGLMSPQWWAAGFSKEILEATRNFTAPSPIQAQSWPIIMSGHDLIGIAATGSGKTLAFGLPALRHLLAQREAGSSSSELSKPLMALADWTP
jgi:superfamily II DNA/RNA helicase